MNMHRQDVMICNIILCRLPAGNKILNSNGTDVIVDGLIVSSIVVVYSYTYSRTRLLVRSCKTLGGTNLASLDHMLVENEGGWYY